MARAAWGARAAPGAGCESCAVRERRVLSERGGLAPVSALLVVSGPGTGSRSPGAEEGEGVLALAVTPAPSRAGSPEQLPSRAHRWLPRQENKRRLQLTGGWKVLLAGAGPPAWRSPSSAALGTSEGARVACLLLAAVSLPESFARQQRVRTPACPARFLCHRARCIAASGGFSSSCRAVPAAGPCPWCVAAGSPVPSSSALPPAGALLQPSASLAWLFTAAALPAR